MSEHKNNKIFPSLLIIFFIVLAAFLAFFTFSDSTQKNVFIWRGLAALDMPDYQYQLGAYLLAHNPDNEDGLNYVIQAGENGQKHAQNYLGYWYDENPENAGDYDFEKAEYWYKKAADQNVVTSLHNLGRLYIKTQQYDLVEAPLIKAAEMGWVNAQNTLGSWYHDQNPNGSYLDKAMIWYEKAAKAGHDMAMHNYATLLRKNGQYEEAIIWYEKSYEAGKEMEFNDSAQALGYLYHKAENAEYHDHEKALSWYKELAKSGRADDLYQSALYYLKTRDRDQRINPQAEQGMIWMREAAEKGNAKAIESIESKKRYCLQYNRKYRRFGCELLSMAGYENAAFYAKLYLEDDESKKERIDAIHKIFARAAIGDPEAIIMVLSLARYSIPPGKSVDGKQSLLSWYYVFVNNYDSIDSAVPSGIAAEYKKEIGKTIPTLVQQIGNEKAVEAQKCSKFYRMDKKRFWQCI